MPSLILHVFHLLYSITHDIYQIFLILSNFFLNYTTKMSHQHSHMADFHRHDDTADTQLGSWLATYQLTTFCMKLVGPLSFIPISRLTKSYWYSVSMGNSTNTGPVTRRTPGGNGNSTSLQFEPRASWTRGTTNLYETYTFVQHV